MSIRIALAGNPNCGKTTLFNALTGSNQYVGNWPGVTVEKKEGKLKKDEEIIVTDLPGIYSLSPYTPEEVVARDYLIRERPDAILNVVDGTNLERNLYLTTQLTEIGIPVVIAINMMDVVRRNGDIIDFKILSKKMGCKVIEVSAIKNEGIEEAIDVAIEAAKEGTHVPYHVFSGAVEHALAHIEEVTVHDLPEEQQRWYAIKIFERDERVLKKLDIPKDTLDHIEKDIQAAERELDDDAEGIIANERYVYIGTVCDLCYRKKNKGNLTVSDRIDQVITGKWLGLPVFAIIMFLVYFLSMAPKAPGTLLTNWANDGLFGEGWSLFGLWVPSIPAVAEALLVKINCAAWLQSLILDGIIAGVGSVLGFVPQLMVLFFLLSFLEACGYMSRIAFVLDRLFRKFGLSGKSFIPILVGTGCGVPGIMASRTIENEKDRRMTVMTTTFIPCGAKVPFISMMAGALFSGSPLVAIGAYLIGVFAIIVSGVMLKKTRPFAAKPSPFVMELPPYHMPTFSNLMKATWDRGWSFIKKAGTVILLFTVVIWFLSNFGFVNGTFRMITETEMDLSILASIGGLFAWMFKPLGWGNWQATVASFTGLAAKENIVGTMGVFYGGKGDTLYDALANEFTYASGLSFLVFNLLCAPCIAAMDAIRREMNSFKWTVFALAWQTGFAYMVALIINQFGNLFTGHVNVPGLAVSIIIILLMLYMIFIKKPYKKEKVKEEKTESTETQEQL